MCTQRQKRVNLSTQCDSLQLDKNRIDFVHILLSITQNPLQNYIKPMGSTLNRWKSSFICIRFVGIKIVSNCGANDFPRFFEALKYKCHELYMFVGRRTTLFFKQRKSKQTDAVSVITISQKRNENCHILPESCCQSLILKCKYIRKYLSNFVFNSFRYSKKVLHKCVQGSKRMSNIRRITSFSTTLKGGSA